ncbi:acyl carrier protein [Pseudazoarcus pumilus]|nr:phosphopantetheine-binding protein [Pseudazoarcus pumilus]
MTTTTETTIADQVRAALVAPTGFKVEQIESKHTFVADLRMDSLDQLEAVLAVEEACGVELPDETLEHAHTVGDLIALVERARGAE